MKHRYYPILLLYFFQVACMPEEDLPIRHTGETPEYFIECYCQPGRPFALSATSVLPVSEDLQIDFSKEMKDHIAGKALFDQKNGKIAWLIIMLVWIPNYISYLPGVFTVDAINQIEQFASHNLTNHHPILTTFIEAPIVLLGKHMGYLGIG